MIEHATDEAALAHTDEVSLRPYGLVAEFVDEHGILEAFLTWSGSIRAASPC